MTKELEALNKIQHDFGQLKGQELVKCYETIFNGLKRLESIDNANPSEALEKFDYIGNDIKFAYDDDYVSYDYTDDVEYIKQALLKAQEKAKVLEIAFKKRIDLENFYISFVDCHCDYNYYYNNYGTYGKYELTEEEFELIKSYLKIFMEEGKKND